MNTLAQGRMAKEGKFMFASPQWVETNVWHGRKKMLKTDLTSEKRTSKMIHLQHDHNLSLPEWDSSLKRHREFLKMCCTMNGLILKKKAVWEWLLEKRWRDPQIRKHGRYVITQNADWDNVALWGLEDHSKQKCSSNSGFTTLLTFPSPDLSLSPDLVLRNSQQKD